MLGELYSIAECRFSSNEHFVRKNNTLQAYTEQVQDYIEERGHAEKVSAEDFTSLPLNTSTCQCTLLKRLLQQQLNLELCVILAKTFSGVSLK